MKKAELTVSEALKFSRHDFLNELQLVLMYIDLGEPTRAKAAIQNATNTIQQLSILSKLGLPAMERWIGTFGWMYPAFQTKLLCDIESGIREANDVAIASYLDDLFSEVEEMLEATSEYEASIEVHASSVDWSINITVSGALNIKQQVPEVGQGFLVEETVTDSIWKLRISGN